RLFESVAVENPAYWRIVHNLPRYIDACGPRVYGNSPGLPRSHAASKSRSRRLDSSKKTGMSMPDVVVGIERIASHALIESPTFTMPLSGKLTMNATDLLQ